jgi:hypothetical protein
MLARLEGGRIFPVRNPDTLRIVRKVVRGLAFFHGLLPHVPEDRITVRPTKYEIPLEVEAEARIREVRHTAVFDCLGFVVADLSAGAVAPDDMHSFWRLRFYDRVRFDAWIAPPP